MLCLASYRGSFSEILGWADQAAEELAWLLVTGFGSPARACRSSLCLRPAVGAKQAREGFVWAIRWLLGSAAKNGSSHWLQTWGLQFSSQLLRFLPADVSPFLVGLRVFLEGLRASGFCRQWQEGFGGVVLLEVFWLQPSFCQTLLCFVRRVPLQDPSPPSPCRCLCPRRCPKFCWSTLSCWEVCCDSNALADSTLPQPPKASQEEPSSSLKTPLLTDRR